LDQLLGFHTAEERCSVPERYAPLDSGSIERHSIRSTWNGRWIISLG
jgi:hypothetical protein